MTKKQLGQFFTVSSDIHGAMLSLLSHKNGRALEPSAGNGSFSLRIPDCVALDIEPGHPSIIKANFFDFQPPRITGKLLVVGNPPFGIQNNLAVRFINHAASLHNEVDIAFILPVSFRKQSILNRIDPFLHVTRVEPLPENSFMLGNGEYSVPCSFFVFSKQDKARMRPPTLLPVHFKFVPKSECPDFAIRRVGGRAGELEKDWQSCNVQTHYFVRCEKEYLGALTDALRHIDYGEILLAVGPKSISKQEILSLLPDSLVSSA